MAQQKIDKEFCLTDNTVNVYGYRLLTEGLQLESFNPPIGYLMHNRDAGVAVKWEDFRVDGDKLYAKPVVNTTLCPGLADQINDGFYNGASVGHIVALEVSNEPDAMLQGQTGPTVTKWFPRECSVVDIPGNQNALAQLYDENDNLLHDLIANPQTFITHKTVTTMEGISVSATGLSLLNLKADATTAQFDAALADLSARAAKAATLQTEINDLKAEYNKKTVADLIAKGKTDRKLTNELAATLEKDYATNPEGLKALIDNMPAQTVVTDLFDDSKLPEKFKGKTYQELYISGDLADLKAKYPDYYTKLKEGK
jgi:hypothetical protein